MKSEQKTVRFDESSDANDEVCRQSSQPTVPSQVNIIGNSQNAVVSDATPVMSWFSGLRNIQSMTVNIYRWK